MNNKIDIYLFLFLQTIGIIQLIEYFVWTNTFSNEILSKIATIIILIQPILLIITLNNQKNRNILLYSYIALILIYYIFFYSNIDFSMKSTDNGHLDWNWMPNNKIFIFIYIIYFLLPVYLNGKYFNFMFGLITFIITYIYYSKDKTYGSLWCWIANLISLKLIFYVFLDDLCLEYKK